MFDRIRSAFNSKQQEGEDDTYPSIVLLLREPLYPTSNETLQRAQESWAFNGPVELVSIQDHGSAKSYLLKSGDIHIAIHFANRKYDVDFKQTKQAMNEPWIEHTAWISIDIPSARSVDLIRKGGLGVMYRLLLFFAFKTWNNNCLGAYFPAAGIMIPNFGDLADCLVWANRNGYNLDFLNLKK